MPRYALDCQFDGRHFQGTQIQRSGATLQGLLSESLRALTGEAAVPRPASRLDAGVSAEHLPVDVQLGGAWAPRELAAALNARLPRELVICRIALVDDRFHAQHDALKKRYRYTIVRRATRPVLDTHAAWVRRIDDPPLLHAMARLLIGRQDLGGFACLRRDGSDEDDPVRTVSAAAWQSEPADDGERWRFSITADGFLYKQIRGMVGAMIAVAQGRRTLAAFAASVTGGRAAEKLGNIAPAHGLVLERVEFAHEPPWEWP